MLISWSFDAKIVIAIKIRLIAQPYRMGQTISWRNIIYLKLPIQHNWTESTLCEY